VALRFPLVMFGFLLVMLRLFVVVSDAFQHFDDASLPFLGHGG
jgi:hypothetical protein